MNWIESCCTRIRHVGPLEGMDHFWRFLAPAYDAIVMGLGKNGIERTINGTDRMLVHPTCRGVSESYEPELWKHITSSIEPGDAIVDVGGYVGLYTMAFALRSGPRGRTVVFEPDATNYMHLRRHIELNHLTSRVEAINAAAANYDGVAKLSLNSCETRVMTTHTDEPGRIVQACRLDSIIRGPIGIVKIDVEGLEEKVLEGAERILSNRELAPRRIYIEMHPFAWADVGTTDSSLISRLSAVGYELRTLKGEPVERIERHCNAVAYKRGLDGLLS